MRDSSQHKSDKITPWISKQMREFSHSVKQSVAKPTKISHILKHYSASNIPRNLTREPFNLNKMI